MMSEIVEPVTAERIEFDVHANIIHDLIHSQNGTVSTAIRELVMNAIDAGSEKCEIKVHKKGFSVIDWGKGFDSEKDIKTYFKNFGEPHEEGDAEFGRFRIGRGQIMAFGKVIWTSNQYSMTVDTRKNGFTFDYKNHGDIQWAGCRVDGVFYQELSDYHINHIKDELKDFICFADIQVLFNGESLNRDIEKEHWDIDDGEILIQWKTGDGIQIYSKGVFVKRIDAYRYGFEARVVTRNALKLNMARNEVTDNDPLWVRITEYFSEKAREIAKRKGKAGRIDTATRRGIIRQFLSGSLPVEDVLEVCLFKDCRGHSISIRNIANSKLNLSVSLISGSRKAEAIATRRLAQVLDFDVLEEFDVCSLDDLKVKIANTLKLYYSQKIHYINNFAQSFKNKETVDIDLIAGRLVNDNTIYPKEKYTPRESAARNALQYGSNLMARELSKRLERDVNRRNILLGNSGVADGWTNGLDTIVITRHLLPCLDTLSRSGGFQMAMLLLHEYLHDEDDSGSHQHDFEFMSQFHDIASDCHHDVIGCVGMGMYKRYLTELSNKNLDLPAKIKSEFNYPVINDVFRYVLTTNTRKVDSLTKAVFNWLELPYKIEKGNIVISIARTGKYTSQIDQCFHRAVKQLGSDIKKPEYYKNLHEDYAKGMAAYRRKLTEELKTFMNSDNVDIKCFEGLASANNLEEVFVVLCSTEQSEIQFVTEDYYGRIRNVFNSKVDYSHAIHNPFPGQSWGDNRYLQTHDAHQSFAADKSGRLSYAKKIIEHAFMGLKDSDERRELADHILNETGKDSLLPVAELYVDN